MLWIGKSNTKKYALHYDTLIGELESKNMSNPYERFDQEDLILRDHLAIDRTILANERTYLAYIRTALTLFIGGVTFIKFFDSIVTAMIGWAFLPAACVAIWIGYTRYINMRSSIASLRQRPVMPQKSDTPL